MPLVALLRSTNLAADLPCGSVRQSRQREEALDSACSSSQPKQVRGLTSPGLSFSLSSFICEVHAAALRLQQQQQQHQAEERKFFQAEECNGVAGESPPSLPPVGLGSASLTSHLWRSIGPSTTRSSKEKQADSTYHWQPDTHPAQHAPSRYDAALPSREEEAVLISVAPPTSNALHDAPSPGGPASGASAATYPSVHSEHGSALVRAARFIRFLVTEVVQIIRRTANTIIMRD